MKDTIGVDISKDRLDAYSAERGEHRSFSNDTQGQRALRRWAGAALVVFEPTGAYHRAFERGLAQAGCDFHKVNPLMARRFAQSCGRLGKTDRADAAALARMGVALALPPDRPLSENLHDLRELVSAREGALRDQTRAKIRSQTVGLPLLRRQIRARLAQIARQIAALDAEIDRLIAADPVLARRREILTSIPGIGKLSAALIVVLMPELGQIDGKQAASLAGLAPITRQSGKWQGKAHIGGGSAQLRRALYMPALSASLHNPDLAAKRDAFASRNKPLKVAITAIMRNLITLANALLRDDRFWAKIRT